MGRSLARRTAAACLVLSALGPSLVDASPPVPRHPEPLSVRGLVVDVSGAPVAGATVSVVPAGAAAIRTQTDGEGRFVINGLPAGRVAITAVAAGFTETAEPIEVGAAGLTGIRLVLRPAGFSESVSVTASRGVHGLEAPASVSVITADQLTTSAAGAVDDLLRGTPGFSLFRRSSSRVANPTTQGVTLRGISGSGASRTLVLADGVPLNDPFGSWVYWNRVPLAAVERVEVVRGAAGDLYGADAMGGVIQILTFSPGRARFRAIVEGASHQTARASLFGSRTRHGWSATVAGEWLDTHGVPVVAARERGPVDVAAYADYWTGFASLGYASSGWRAELRGSQQGEQRGNGTPLQRNDTRWRQISASLAGPLAGGLWNVQAEAGTQRFFQTFSAVSGARDTERLTTEQRVPTPFGMASGQWARSIGHVDFMVGAEGKRTTADVNETRYSAGGTVSGSSVTGGSERTGSLYARVAVAASSTVSVNAGVRGDFWHPRSREAGSPQHASSFLSPRISVVWRPQSALTLHASVYRAHRTPTLNELYRGFRAGNVVTNPNDSLEPEHLTGTEAGLLTTRGPASVRVTGFLTDVTNAVTNVTVSATPALIVRQRQNTDTLRAAGLEIEAEVRPHRYLSISGQFVLTSSGFVNTPAQPALAGKSVPQVPRHRFGASLTWAHPRIATVVADLRVSGAQFDDDQNTLPLAGFSVVDLSATRAVSRVLHLFAAVENLFDAEYDVGRTPVRTIGWPRTVRGGIRVFLP